MDRGGAVDDGPSICLGFTPRSGSSVRREGVEELVTMARSAENISHRADGDLWRLTGRGSGRVENVIIERVAWKEKWALISAELLIRNSKRRILADARRPGCQAPNDRLGTSGIGRHLADMLSLTQAS
jgi:hypothetical protein